MNNDRFTRGLIIGGIIGATVSGMMNRGDTFKWRKKMMRAGKNAFTHRNGIVDAILDLF